MLVAELQLLNQHRQQTPKREVDPLLFLNLFEPLLIDPRYIHKEQISIVIDLDIQLRILRISRLSNKEPEGEHCLGADLSALFVDLADFDGDCFGVDRFHVALEEWVQVLDP